MTPVVTFTSSGVRPTPAAPRATAGRTRSRIQSGLVMGWPSTPSPTRPAVSAITALTAAAWTKADRAVSDTHTLSNPASSTSRESTPSPRRGPPTTTPKSTTPEGYTLPTARMGGGATVPACLLAHVLGARAKALSHDLQHLRGDRGTGLDEPLEVPRGQAEHGDLRLGGHRSRPGSAVEQRDLPEEVPRPELGTGPVPHLHAGGALHDEEEADASLPLLGQHRSGPMG